MADVNLSVGSSNVDKSYSGVHTNQVIHFYCSYNSSGTVTIRCNVSVTSYDFNASQGAGYITIDGTTTNRTKGTFKVSKNSNSDFLTATKSITTAKTFTVTAKVDAYAGGWGPVPSGGRTFSFTVSVPGVTYACKAPTDLWVSSYYVNPGGNVTVSWSGASGGQNNAISRYWLEWGYSDEGWDYGANSYTSSGSSSVSITVPSGEGKRLNFRVRTEGAAGVNYYSGYYREDDLVRLRSRPTMSACSASQSLGTYTITWSAATDGIDNAVSKYEIWYSYKTSSSGSWSTRTRIANVSSSTRSYTWSGGTVGYYYRFSVVALGTNYLYSATTDTWSAGYKKDYSYTACGAPSNLKSDNTNPTIGQTITLTWTAGTAGTNNSVTGYELYYSTNQGSTYNLISSSITGTSYSYTVPRTPGDIRFRIRTKGSAGTSYYSSYNYSSSYQTITIKQANPPTVGTVTATLIDSGSSGGKAFSISWAGFAGNTYNPISGYALYYKSSKTIDDSDFSSSMTAISSNLSSSTTSYTWSGGNWNYYYKFYVKAKGQYYGESPYAESTAVLKETEDSTPPTEILYKGSGYIKYRGSNYAIPGLKIEAMPIGASNANYYTIEYREVKENGTATSWRVVGKDISLNKYTYPVTISKSLVNGDYIEFRAKSKNIAGEYSEYFPSDADLYNYRIPIKRFKRENETHPRVQIKRAHTDAWTRESSDIDGIRIFDGELAYDTEKRILKIGNYTDNTPKKFNELSNMFGLLEVGTDNSVTAINSAAIGNNNICEEQRGYAILGVSNGTTVTLSTVEGLSAGMTVKYSYTGSTYSTTITSINSANSTIVTSSSVSYYDYGQHDMSHGAMWVDTDLSRGDIVVATSSGLLIGSNNRNQGLRNLVSGNSNSIPRISNYSYSYDNIIVGSNNSISSYMYNSAVFGYGHKITYCSNSLIQGYSNTITSGSYMLVSGAYNNTSGSYNLIGYYLSGGGESYGLTIGKYNSTVENSLFVVGSGTGTSAKSNAFYITTSAIQMNKAVTIDSTLRVNSTTNFYSSSYYRNGTGSYFYNSSGNSCGRIYGTTMNSTNTMYFTGSSFYFDDDTRIANSLMVSTSSNENTIGTNTCFISGFNNTMTGNCQTNAIIGRDNTTNEHWQWIFGYNNNAKAQLQNLIGTDLTGHSSFQRQVVVGQSNRAAEGHFLVGGGSTRNAFRVNGVVCYSYQGVNTSGADYAEYFEWEDGNPDGEDRVGYFVTHSGEKIKIAKEDDFIIGIVSATPAIIGNNPEEWNNRFLKDIYGRTKYEKVLIPDKYVDNTTETKEIGLDGKPVVIKERILIEKEHYEDVPILNPDFDESQEYIERDKRKEWSCVGFMGKLVVKDDGTCVSGGFCKCNNDGIATNSLNSTRYRVLKRLDNSHIKVLIL